MIRLRILGRRPEPEAGGGRSAALEIQIHPAEINRQVRYLFLSRRQLVRWAGGLALYLAFLAAGAVIAPRVVRGLLSAREYRTLEAERVQQGERLRALNARLEELQGRSEELRLQIRKVLWAYGLPDEESIGQGGFPQATPAVGASIYSRDVQVGLRLSAEIGDQLRVIDTFLAEVQEFEAAKSDQVRYTPSIRPLPAETFVLTSPFSERTSPFTTKREFHAGIDLAAAPGTPIHATADGVVVFAGRFPLRQSVGWWRYGNLVVVRHGDSFITLYGHCEEIKVRQHQKVRRGELVATVGSSGWSTSPHLHYEVRRRDEEGSFLPLDPRIYILDHRWDDQERLLVRSRYAPPAGDYEPLPRLLTR